MRVKRPSRTTRSSGPESWVLAGSRSGRSDRQFQSGSDPFGRRMRTIWGESSSRPRSSGRPRSSDQSPTRSRTTRASTKSPLPKAGSSAIRTSSARTSIRGSKRRESRPSATRRSSCFSIWVTIAPRELSRSTSRGPSHSASSSRTSPPLVRATGLNQRALMSDDNVMGILPSGISIIRQGPERRTSNSYIYAAIRERKWQDVHSASGRVRTFRRQREVFCGRLLT